MNELRIETSGGSPVDSSAIFPANSDTYVLVKIRALGGKGGFGANLKSLGGRMNKKQTTNFDACRDLSGRRLRSVNHAKKLAEYIEKEPERRQKKQEELSKKLNELTAVPPKPMFNDAEFMNQKEQLVDDVKTAVAKSLREQKSSSSTKPLNSEPKKGRKQRASAVATSAIKIAASWDEYSDEDE